MNNGFVAVASVYSADYPSNQPLNLCRRRSALTWGLWLNADRWSVQYMRILVVGGYPDGAESLRTVLEHYGHEVGLASTGTEGLAAAREFLQDLIFCELALAGTNGLDVCRALRATPIQVT